MIKKIFIKPLILMFLVSGCVTVNVYFPAAAAEQAADRIINEIYGNPDGAASESMTPQTNNEPLNDASMNTGFAKRVLNFLIPSANAQAANMDITTPAINSIKASMTQRHTQLAPFYNNAAIGMDSKGLITLHDAKSVTIKDRNTVNQLIAAENQDRNALYTEIAKANGHPEWESQIRETFARRWIANAPAGWYFQDTSGSWKQK